MEFSGFGIIPGFQERNLIEGFEQTSHLLFFLRSFV